MMEVVPRTLGVRTPVRSVAAHMSACDIATCSVAPRRAVRTRRPLPVADRLAAGKRSHTADTCRSRTCRRQDSAQSTPAPDSAHRCRRS